MRLCPSILWSVCQLVHDDHVGKCEGWLFGELVFWSVDYEVGWSFIIRAGSSEMLITDCRIDGAAIEGD